MKPKINRILIPIIAIILLNSGSHQSTAALLNTYSSYLPILSSITAGWIGPYGGYVVCIVVDPQNPQTVYAGTWGSGVFKSEDGGQSWVSRSLGLVNLYINSMAIDPQHPATLYAGTYNNQVYKSVDSGANWFWSGSGMQDQSKVYSIAVDPVTPSVLYAATRGVSNNGNPPWSGVLYRSLNSGNTWQAVLVNIGGTTAQDWVYSIAVSPTNHNVVYVASHEHGPFRSTDSGSSWQPISNGIADYSGRAIAVSPQISWPNTLYFGVWHIDTVYKSIDSGDNWQNINRGYAYLKVYNMAIDPSRGDTVYIATFNSGVLKTSDGGSSWAVSGLQSDKLYTLAINPKQTSNLFAGTYGDGLFISPDGSSTWQPSNFGLDNSMVTSVVINLGAPNKIYSSVYGAGIVQAKAAANPWSYLNSGLGDKFVHSLVAKPNNYSIMYALTDTGGLYQINLNNGNAWVQSGVGLPLTTSPAAAFAPDNPFATREMQENLPPVPNILSINQASWVNLLTMVFAPSNSQIAYIGTGGSGVYKSSDGGSNWQYAGLAGESVLSLAVDPLNENLVYAATATSGSFKASQNGGASWSSIALPTSFYAVATSPSSPGIVYAGTSSGLYKYQSGNWYQIGLADKTVTAVLADPNQPNIIYTGTTDGAYYTDDGGLLWIKVSTLLDGITIQSISLDPINSNQVYFATSSHGIYNAVLYYFP